jgi:hypothetical protein
MKVTEQEMMEALNRSGYILESEVAKQLSEWDFFIQSGPVVKDPITGKGREIDIIAERWGSGNNANSELKTHTSIEYVFEIKNNSFPIVLLNKFRFSPNIEPRFGLKEAASVPNSIDYHHDHIFFDELIENNTNIFTQYCSFHKKKGQNNELMASHPERFHESISKIIQHCDEQFEHNDQYLFNEASEEVEEDGYFRHRLYLPILLVNDDVLEMSEDGLKKVDNSTLVVNYYHKGEPYTAYMFIVTKYGLADFLSRTEKLKESVLSKMNEAREKQLAEYDIVLHKPNPFSKEKAES